MPAPSVKDVRFILLCILEAVEVALEGVRYVLEAVDVVLEALEVLEGMRCVMGAMTDVVCVY